jgi:glutamyl-tRNA reductase
MKLFLAGISHKTAPVDVRERCAFDASIVPAGIRMLKRSPEIAEAMILSTCNRVEIAVSAQDGCDAMGRIQECLLEVRKLDPAWVRPYLYHFEDSEAVRHLFRVASSLDSMMVGEPQILGQLKAAYGLAKAEGALTGALEVVVTRAFNVAKRIRSETGIGRNAVSVSYAAVELAREIFGSLNSRKVLIIGAGKMSELAARHLRRSGASNIFVTNRTHDRARELAALFDGHILEYDRFLGRLHEIDIVITSSRAPHYILSKDQMRRVIDARKNRPMFLIDIAVPRNIDPSVNDLDNIYLYDIDDLQRVVDRNREDRNREAASAEEIVSLEVDRTLSRLKAREVAPTIVSLQEQLEQIRKAEILRIRGKLGPLNPQQEEAIQALTRGIVNKIAHGPISELRRRAAEPDGLHVIDTIRRVFHLEHK